MRLPDWPQRLEAAFDAARTKPFAYGGLNGAQDCALFAADCVLAITGVDYAATLRGYDSKIAAYRIVTDFGSMEGMITKLLGREPKHPTQAMRGDIVLAEVEVVEGESGECLGVCAGNVCAFPQQQGIRMLSTFVDGRPRARLAWSIE